MESGNLARGLLGEHARIAELGDQLRGVVASPPRGERKQWLDAMRFCFDEYALHLQQHLKTEEEGGYLRQVVELRPTLSEAVEIIRHEHSELAQILQDVQMAIHDLRPADNLMLRDCSERIKNLMHWIERHEEHENHIVMYAFTQDLGMPG
jgi:hemerythrin-like domain-containing protein